MNLHCNGTSKRHWGSADEFDIDYHREGKSNETLFLDWGDYNLVLRRPPAGATAESAHDVHREYRILDALQGDRHSGPSNSGEL